MDNTIPKVVYSCTIEVTKDGFVWEPYQGMVELMYAVTSSVVKARFCAKVPKEYTGLRNFSCSLHVEHPNGEIVHFGPKD
jgi:hypothetical protein